MLLFDLFEEEFECVIVINFKGIFVGVCEVVWWMIEVGCGGVIVNVVLLVGVCGIFFG